MSVVRLEIRDAVGHIVLDRPPANAYDKAFMDDLDAAIEEARRNDEAKAILVRSASERFFSAGADVSVFAKHDRNAENEFLVCANGAIEKLEALPKVVVAAIGGHCLGGGLEIALCCDFRIAGDGPFKIGLTEVALGLLPGTGGTQRLPRLIGRQKALDLMLRGAAISPQDALAAGIVDEVVPQAELLDRALARTRAYAGDAAFAKGQIKLATVQGLARPLAEGLKVEREALFRVFNSEDAKEGVTAFLEKRKPNYKGK